MTLMTLFVLLAKVTVVLGAAFVITRALRHASSGTRHAVWLIAMSATLTLPLVEGLVPWRIALLPAWMTAQPSAVSAPVRAGDVASAGNEGLAARPGDADPVIGASGSAALAPGAPLTAGAPLTPGAPLAAALPPETYADPTLAHDEATASTASDALVLPDPVAATATRSVGSAVLLLWLGGVLAIGAWLLQGWVMARRIVRRATPVTDASWLSLLYETADRVGLDDAPRLVQSREVRMPFACNMATPTIVIPAESAQWPLDRRRAVLLHELAHVQRRDLLGHTLARVVCAVYWFHPAVWLAAGRLRAESEQACDDMAVRAGARPADYAEHLLDIVTGVRVDHTPSVAIAMARRSEFEGRMLAILDPARVRLGPNKRLTLSAALLLGAVTLLTGAAAPVREHDRADIVTTAATPASDRASADAGSWAPDADIDTDVDAESAQDTITRRRRGERPAPATPPTPPADPLDPALPATPPSAVTPHAPAAPAPTWSGGESVFEWEQPALAPREARPPRGARGDWGLGVLAPSAIDAIALSALDASMAGLARRPSARDTAARISRDERARLLIPLVRSDSSAEVRRISAWGLHEMVDASEPARAALLAVVRNDPSPNVREMAAWALSYADDGADVRAVLPAALSAERESGVRATLAWTIGVLHMRAGETALVALLNDPERKTRIRAAWALGNVAPERAPPALHARLADSDKQVRRAAAWAIRQIGDAASVAPLAAAIRTETDSTLRVTYLRALASLGEASMEAARALLTSDNAAVRTEAVRALVGRGAPHPWPWPWPDPRAYP
ncbi:MAG: HEAT repeat domain-containing protein [Gemmatimonadaceae bacterium]|jgi:beta-lactamase regulating signal transducer with metallopeptidase domain/HEAT repeat protein|nr:HEAT repeat domain-containing protein [Gemmatimonadaceae bacterium]